MNKLFFVTSSYPSHDFKFVKSLKKRGLDISVFVIRPQNISKSQKVSGVKYYNRKRNKTLLYSLDYILSFFYLFFLIKNKCKTDKPDILHGGNVQTAGFLCSLIGFKPFFKGVSSIRLIFHKSICGVFFVFFTWRAVS